VLSLTPFSFQVKTYFYDSYAHYTEILDNPTKYGFKDATSYGSDADIFWG
jgi:phospholipase/lecithinase/hemolysin